MMKSYYFAFCDRCAKGLFLVAMVFCTAMLAVAVAHVVMRYVFNNALTWSEEFLRFAMVWFTLVSAAVLHHQKGHVGIIIFRDMFPDRLRAFCIRLIPLLAVIATASVTINGVRLLLRTYKQMTPALNISMAIPYAAIPVGFFFMTLFGVAHILEISFGKSVPERQMLS
jgi:TRAP-type C4-dicarboxylate transport system permease small subunit